MTSHTVPHLGVLSEPDHEAIRQHTDWMRRCGRTAITRSDRTCALRRLARALPMDLLAATEAALERWQAGLQVSPAALANYTIHVRQFYEWAFDAGLIGSNPARKLPIPRGLCQPRPRPISEGDFAAAIRWAPEPLRTWLLLAAYLGLRAIEISRIRAEDIYRLGDKWRLRGIGKGDKPFDLPLPAVVLEPLLARKREVRTGPLWRVRGGGPIKRHNISHRCNRYLRSLGLDDTLHALRHRYGTQVYAVTRDPGVTRDAMRHESMNTTMKMYVQIANAAVAAALDALPGPQTLQVAS